MRRRHPAAPEPWPDRPGAERREREVVARVLVTRRLPDGGLDPLVGHEIIGPKPDDAPYTHGELRAYVRACDAIVCLLTDRIDAAVVDAAAGSVHVIANVAVGYDNVDVRAPPARASPCATRPACSTTRPPTSRSR